MNQPYLSNGGGEKFNFNEITTEEVIDHIKSLTNSAAFGTNTISNQLIKNAKYIISPVLASIANNCFKTGIFPESWKTGKICVVHKKGSKHELKNYRPVTLLCSLSKVVEKAVFKQLYNYFDENQLFDERQYGFRSGLSTNLAILDYINVVLKAKESPTENKVNTILLDLSAAFDIVPHDLLLDKMSRFGLSDLAIKLLSNYLKGRGVFVEVEDQSGGFYLIKYGVPQGSILGPLLYIIFISDIYKIDQNPKIIYADDTNIVVIAKSNEELEENSNLAMENVINYYAGAELKLNKEKTEVINHNSKNTPVSVIVDPENGTEQESVRDARMLGVQVDTDLTFKRHIDNVIRDINTRLYYCAKVFKIASLKVRRMYGFAMLLSKFYYATNCYSGACPTDLERMRVSYDKCIRMIYKPSSLYIRAEDMRAELEVMSFWDLIKYCDIITITRIIRTGSPNSLFKDLTLEGGRITRGYHRKIVKVSYIPKTERLKRAFLIRSVKYYNAIPEEFKTMTELSLKKELRNYFLSGRAANNIELNS